MNKQPSSTIITRLCWGVFFLALLFLAFQVMPRALGQRDAASKPSADKPSAAVNLAAAGKQGGVPASLVGASQATPRGLLTPNLSPWTIVADYPLVSESVAVASDGTFAYAVGGFDGVNFVPTNSFNRYDPVANTWTPLPNIPTGFYDAPAVYAANTHSIYVFGGFDTNFVVRNITQIYNIGTGTWTTGAPMPDPNGRYFASGAYYPGNGKIYVIGGFDGATFSEQSQTWEYDPVGNTWDTSRESIPVPMGGAGYSIVGQFIYLAGHWNNGSASTDHYRYDIVGNSWASMAPVPVAIYRPGAAGIGTNTYLVGGGNPFFARGFNGQARKLASMRSPATSYSSTYIYDTVANSWTTGPNTNVAHSFTGGTAIGNRLIVVTGYDGFGDTNTVEMADAQGTPTPTPTPSPTPCNVWTQGTPYPTTIVRYGFAQTATHFYVFGGVDNGTIVNTVNRMDIASGVWEPRAAMPISGEAGACALDSSSGIVYCTEGSIGSGFASYDIATDSWTTLASIPQSDTYGSASGAFNGKVFVAGGSGGITNAVWVYDIGTNSWSAGTAAPNVFLLAGYQQVGQFLYVVGGFDPTFVNNATTSRLDMSSAPGVWEAGPAFTPQRADFGLAYDTGTNKLYALAGDLPNDGNPFNSTNLVDEFDLGAWPGGTWNPSLPDMPQPNRQANQAGFFGAGDIWSVGGIVGQTFQFLSEVQHRTNGSCAGNLNLLSAASVKGPFAIDLPLSGPSGVEDRSGGPNKKYSVVMTFDQNIASVGSASSTCGSVQSIQIENSDPHNVRINLVNVAHACNGSTITVTADSITDDQGNVLDSASVGLGLLLGDVNADRVVNRSDTNEAQMDKGQKTDEENFRSDVNASGHINRSDIELIRQQQGTSLP